MDVAVDDGSDFFLGLHACKGSGKQYTFKARGASFSICHLGAWDPFSTLQANGSSLRHEPSRLRSGGDRVAPSRL